MPRAFGPVALAKGDACPAVAGRFRDASAPISWAFAARNIRRDPGNIDWASVDVAGVADTALAVTVATHDGQTETTRLRKGTRYSGDYFCADGWLQLGDGTLPSVWDSAFKTPGFMPRRRSMRVATGANGALVARLDFTDYDEFTVWCGDGCKGIPLPWTFRTQSRWSSAPVWTGDLPAEPLESDGSRVQLAQVDTVNMARLARAEYDLEHGSPIPGEGDARDRARRALVGSMLLRGVAKRDDGWQLSVEFAQDADLDAFVARLADAANVHEVRVLPSYRGRMSNGRWSDVVFVR